MIDGLSIITGIAITVFLLFYLAFNVDKEHVFLKIIIIFAGLFLLALIPTTTIQLENQCSILNNGTYICYQPNGTQIENPADTQIGSTFTNSYLWIIRIFVAYVFVFYSWKMLNYFNFLRKSKYRFRRPDE